MGPFNITSFHREYEYKLQSLLLLAFSNKLATNNIGSELIASLVALVCANNTWFCKTIENRGGIKMQNDQSLIHGVAILSPIKL